MFQLQLDIIDLRIEMIQPSGVVLNQGSGKGSGESSSDDREYRNFQQFRQVKGSVPNHQPNPVGIG